MKPTTYSIQQVSEITGLSKQVIRKWEDRYHIIQPQRLDNGYRIYTDNEIKILQQLIKLTNTGMTIKQAINNYLEQRTSSQINPIFQFREALIQAGTNANEHEILHILEQAHHKFGVEKMISQIVIPFLHEVGRLWCEKVWGEYQEAISSQTVRDFLSNVRRRFFVAEDAPLVIGSCLPGERHEIPMQILLIQCMLRGYRTIMLGPSPAESAIESAVQLKGPDIVLLTGSTEIAFTEHLENIQTLEKFALEHPHISFFIGGAGSESYYDQLQLHAIKLSRTIQDILPD
ncbi:MAG: MerR family transcriptional regulator [Solibacillus sp.]|uniref:MerR family transcriptional regulator n=1 Tax=unclassified Solibacillus TaxID=2637870 RepID=UPI0030F6ABE8